jgi:hypothetical protein
MTRIGVVFITNGALEWKTTRHRPVLRSIHFRTDGCEWIKASTRLYVERKRIGLLDLPLVKIRETLGHSDSLPNYVRNYVPTYSTYIERT